MKGIKDFFRREPVLVIAALAAAVSCCFVPPDREYLNYFDLRTLALLYCLMTVVAGLNQAGLFARLAGSLCARAGSVRRLGLALVLLSFFSSMFITNDVALITFVPFAGAVLVLADRPGDLSRVVVLQTVAANLGSMLTPVGNPQNLYLYSRYGFTMGTFLSVTFPVWAVSLVLCAAACFLLPGAKLERGPRREPAPVDRGVWLHAGLFLLCLLTVLRILPWPVMLGGVILVLLIADRKLLGKADFFLLLTFCAFFVFSGNLARIPAVSEAMRKLMSGREYGVSLLASQVISNVPAALLLSGFTEAGRELVLGVDIGGLGTPITSLASLIGLKLYSRTEGAKPGRFLLEFLAVNLVLLGLLTLAKILLA
ncbi:MAG: citrate transporter [Oscillospiraceae bacterium]|nr:citrate transporter [Oscillospiraceae bacterium]